MNVDVVVVTYQSGDDIAGCLGSLPNVASVTVVDNASTDGSADVAEDLGALVIRNTENRGFGAACNQGLAAGDADLVLFLNPDARLTPGCLESLVAAVAADPGLGLVGPRLLGDDGVEQRPIWPFPSAGRAWLTALGLHRLGGPFSDTGTETGFVVGACLLVRRSVLQNLGGFDERYWLYGEEADLARRALELGYGSAVVGSAVARHRGGASGGTVPDVVFEHFHRGTERFIADWQGPLRLVSYRSAMLVGAGLRAAVCRFAPARGHSDFGRTARRMATALRLRPTQVGV